MTTWPTKLLIINTKIDQCMHRTQIQGRIEYVKITVNTEPRKLQKIFWGAIELCWKP